MLSKQFFFTLFFILIIVPFTSAQEKEYEFESAYVKKITTTSGSNIEVVTTEEIYISDYGRKSVSYKNEKRKIKSVNKTEESNSVEIINGEWIINYNPDTKEGTKRKNLSAKFKEISDKEAEQIEKGMKEALNTDTKESGQEIVAGKKCKVVSTTSEIAGIKTKVKKWVYKNFIMKSESESLGNKVKEEVTVFKEGEKTDENKFNVPKDLKLKMVRY